jgi:hypothetical protein
MPAATVIPRGQDLSMKVKVDDSAATYGDQCQHYD